MHLLVRVKRKLAPKICRADLSWPQPMMVDFRACGHFWKQPEWQVRLFSRLHLFSSRERGGHSLDPVTVYWASREPCDSCCRHIKRRGCKKAVDESSPLHVITHEMTTALQGGGKREIDKEGERESVKKENKNQSLQNYYHWAACKLPAQKREKEMITHSMPCPRFWDNCGQTGMGASLCGLNLTGICC